MVMLVTSPHGYVPTPDEYREKPSDTEDLRPSHERGENLVMAVKNLDL